MRKIKNNEKLLSFLKSNFLIYVLIIFGLFVRFYKIGSFPPGLSNDELDMILSSRAIAFTGKSLSGIPFPLFFVKSQMEAHQTNLIPLLLSPYFRFVKLNLFSARLPFLFINFLLCIGLLKLVNLFIKNSSLSSKDLCPWFFAKGDKLLTLSIILVFLTNPWVFVFSRRTFAAPTSLMFLIWAIYYLHKKFSKVTLSFLLFTLSTLSYMGSLAIVPPIAVILSFHKLLTDKKNSKKYLVHLFGYIALVALFIFTSYHIKGGTINLRQSELSFLNIDEYSSSVNDFRRISIQFPLKNLFFNKFTLYAFDMAQKYLNSFNPNYLFVSGDARFTYTFSDHGLLYIIDFFLIIIGLIELKKLSKNLFVIFTALLLVAPLGPLISTVDYSIIYRAYPLSVVFVLLVATGLWALLKTYFKQLVLIIYLLFFADFLVFYFFRYPVSLGENFNVPQRIVASFAAREIKNGKDVVIITSIPYHEEKPFVFYSNINQYTIPIADNYFSKNIEITDDCDSINDDDTVIVDESINCPDIDKDFITIQQQKDAGYRYKIYGSEICNGAILDTYKRFHLSSDYEIENLDNRTFCNHWIFKHI